MRGKLAKEVRAWALRTNVGRPWTFYNEAVRPPYKGRISLDPGCTRAVYQDTKERIKRADLNPE